MAHSWIVHHFQRRYCCCCWARRACPTRPSNFLGHTCVLRHAEAPASAWASSQWVESSFVSVISKNWDSVLSEFLIFSSHKERRRLITKTRKRRKRVLLAWFREEELGKGKARLLLITSSTIAVFVCSPRGGGWVDREVIGSFDPQTMIVFHSVLSCFREREAKEERARQREEAERFLTAPRCCWLAIDSALCHFVFRELRHAAWLEREKKAQAEFTLLKEKEERKKREREEREVRNISSVHFPPADRLRVCLSLSGWFVRSGKRWSSEKRKKRSVKAELSKKRRWSLVQMPLPFLLHLMPHPCILPTVYILYLHFIAHTDTVHMSAYVHIRERERTFLFGFPWQQLKCAQVFVEVLSFSFQWIS